MTNAEKYKDKLIEGSKSSISVCTLLLYVRSNINCKSASIEDCKRCKQASFEWLCEEYKKPEVDWSKVEKGTKVVVWMDKVSPKQPRDFFAYAPELDLPYLAYTKDKGDVYAWRYCELAEEDDNE